ncbi:MAG: hypothetical protein KBE65_20540 [Phycisphaerae bacterium]|nr:hypothetical protein [Phycisphaerae bacterium]
MRHGFVLSVVAFIVWIGTVAEIQPVVRAEELASPTGDRDLIVFVAKEKPDLYRLVGQEPTPYGTAKFSNPKAIVADAGSQCFYVFDEPPRLDQMRKVWRIDGQGNATLVFQGHLTTHGGPFDCPVGLGLDETGRLLVADAITGLWRLEGAGRLQRLVDGKDKPLYRITAAAATREYGLIVGTSYLYEITGGHMLNLPKHMIGNIEFEGTWDPTPSYGAVSETSLGPDVPTVNLTNTGVGNSTGRQVPIRIWRNQGGLYRVDPGRAPAGVDGLLVNRRPDGEEYDTYWRTLRQVFVDAAGRVVLVDAGSARQRTELSYTGGRPTDHPQTRTSTSVINGGVFLLYPDGRFEDLTFKTPDQSSGPMRHPVGAAQWSDDTYIVADPELYVEGINGTGGLLLLKLDGSREARWPFGYRLKPMGVAILRGAGAPAETKPAMPLRIADLVGVMTAGPITRIESVSLERKPQPTGGGLLPPIIINWDKLPAAQAEQKLRSFVEAARWAVAKDGTVRFVGRGVNPREEGNPWVMHGRITMHGQMVNASVSYQRKNLYDIQIGSIDARWRRTGPDTVTMNATMNVFTTTERLKATFEQTMPLQKN